jgi:phage recombination protein Bet
MKMSNEIVELKQDQVPDKRVSFDADYYKSRIRELGWSPEELKMIWSKMPQGVPIDESFAFLSRAKALGLDPMSGQIILQSHTMSKTGEVRYTIIVGIDGYRSMAIRTGLYAPGDDTIFKYKEDGSLLSATVYVKRYHPESNQWNQFSATAMFEEYCVFFYDSASRTRKPTQMWAKMGHTMLEKCAEAKALRRGFPETLAGLYTAEELAQSTSASADAEDAAKRGAKLNNRAVKALGEN